MNVSNQNVFIYTSNTAAKRVIYLLYYTLGVLTNCPVTTFKASNPFTEPSLRKNIFSFISDDATSIKAVDL